MEDVRELAAFVAVADALHLGRAAAALGVPRTTLTGRLRRLEQRLGVVLVDRSHRCRIAVTEDGAALLPAARRTVEAGRAFGAEVEAVRAGRRGVVRVGLAVRRDDPRVERMLETLRSVDERWRVEVVPLDGSSALRSLVVGGLECIISDSPALWAVRRGLPDPRPNRYEPRDGLMVDPRPATRLRVMWRTRWAERRLASGHSRALRDVAWTMARQALDERRPGRVRARWMAASHAAAARREQRLHRREERRLGAAAADARAATRARRRELRRLWRGYVSGDPFICAFVDGTREDGFDVGLGMDPSRPPRRVRPRTDSTGPPRRAGPDPGLTEMPRRADPDHGPAAMRRRADPGPTAMRRRADPEPHPGHGPMESRRRADPEPHPDHGPPESRRRADPDPGPTGMPQRAGSDPEHGPTGAPRGGGPGPAA